MAADPELAIDPSLQAHFAAALSRVFLSGLNEDQTELVTELVKAQQAVTASFERNLSNLRNQFLHAVDERETVTEAFSEFRTTAEADNRKLQDKIDALMHVNSVNLETARAADKALFDEKFSKLEVRLLASEDRAAKRVADAEERAALLVAEAEERYKKLALAAEERAAKQETDRATERAADLAAVDSKLANAKAISDAEKAEEKNETNKQLAKIVTETQSVASEVVDLRTWVLVQVNYFW